tara:strand:+ start:38 stop:355 length:318 start_codon:yes stop_codon:yes gene_type:complete
MPLYKQDPNDSSKQTPDITPGGTARFSNAIVPAAKTIQKRPSYVIINNAGNFSFAYESGSYPTGYITGSVLDGNGGPIRLDINPIAWGGEDVSTGDVTFVYVRVK